MRYQKGELSGKNNELNPYLFRPLYSSLVISKVNG